jgi:CheY-like chemotaxis protein
MPATTAQRQALIADADAEVVGARRAPTDDLVIAYDELSVLVVEDDDSDAELISEILTRMNAIGRLVRAIDGRQALDVVTENAFRPNLILLDLNMPRMDGFEFLAAAREMPLLRGVPVVVLTTSARYADVREALKGTASSYIVKPESVAELAEKIEKVLGTITRGDYLDRRI